jgi:hypothetical protein
MNALIKQGVTVAVVHQNYSENKKQFSIILSQDIMVEAGLSFNDQVSVLFGEPLLSKNGETTMLVTLQKHETKGIKTWKISREKASKDTNGRIKISISSKNKILFTIQNKNINRITCVITESNKNNKILTFALPKEFISNVKECNRSILDFSENSCALVETKKITPSINDGKKITDSATDVKVNTEAQQDSSGSLISRNLLHINKKIDVINDILTELSSEKKNLEMIVFIDCLNAIYKKTGKHHIRIATNDKDLIHIEYKTKNKIFIVFSDIEYLNDTIKEYGYDISFNEFVHKIYSNCNVATTCYYNMIAINKVYASIINGDNNKINYLKLRNALITENLEVGAS